MTPAQLQEHMLERVHELAADIGSLLDEAMNAETDLSVHAPAFNLVVVQGAISKVIALHLASASVFMRDVTQEQMLDDFISMIRQVTNEVFAALPAALRGPHATQ